MKRQPEPATERRSFTTVAQDRFRQGARRRWLVASGCAVVALILLVWLGPEETRITRQLQYYGAPGEMKIMPEISIDTGADPRHRLPRSLQMPSPNAPTTARPRKCPRRKNRSTGWPNR
jgi:hypothetical protein